MASIITGILSSTVCLLLNKVRDKTADQLREGDITDTKIREIIVRELNDVKAKIDGLSRSYLLTSYNFLREGVNLLKACLDKSEAKPKVVHSETQSDGGETSTKSRDVESGILTETLTLSQAMGKVKINSDKNFESSIDRFKDARKEATRAFCNEALSIKDRIFAAKLRIVSELLECLESPETAITNCLPFLETFHSLPAIRELFSVYINRGVKSKVNKAERVENVKSVMLINYVLFQFVSEFSNEHFTAIIWPTIELGDRSFHPVLSWKEISTRRSWGEEFIQSPNEVVLDKEIDHFYSAVNSRGEIIVRAFDGNINVISRSGEVKIVKLNYPGDGDVIKQCVRGLAVDSNNNVYFLMYLESRTESGVVNGYVLYIFSEHYNVKQNCTLHFLRDSSTLLFSYAGIAIDKDNNILINIHNDPHVYVCDSAGELKHKFKLNTTYVRRLATSDKNEILLLSSDHKAVQRYTEKGDLESTIKVPEGHVTHSVAFHHVICKIMVLTFIAKSDSYFLLCYSETGELESSTFLCKGYDYELPKIKSHQSGPVVVTWKRRIIFI